MQHNVLLCNAQRVAPLELIVKIMRAYQMLRLAVLLEIRALLAMIAAQIIANLANAFNFLTSLFFVNFCGKEYHGTQNYIHF